MHPNVPVRVLLPEHVCPFKVRKRPFEFACGLEGFGLLEFVFDCRSDAFTK